MELKNDLGSFPLFPPIQGTLEEDPEKHEGRGLRFCSLPVLAERGNGAHDGREGEDGDPRRLHPGGDLAGRPQRVQEEHEGWGGRGAG